MNSYIAVIPARAGSKRLPGKNKLPLGGKPLIQWTIEAAQSSRYLDDVLVTTDDPEILDVCKSLSVRAIMRPARLATDFAGTSDVCLHAMEMAGRTYDYVILLQPTSPLRTSTDIDGAIELCETRNCSAVVSMSPLEHPVEWSCIVPSDGNISGRLAIPLNSRSQDQPIRHGLNGAIYVVKSKILQSERTFLPAEKLFSYIMPRERSVDIDTKLDLILAEAYLTEKAFELGLF